MIPTKEVVINTLLVLVMIALAVYIQITYSKEPTVYNCDIAEISPDIPTEVKEECRKLTKAGMI